MKDLEYIVNGIIVEDENKAEQDEARKKRMLASAFVMVRNKTGMNRKEFAAWLGIPYRTMQDWERSVSSMPDYVLALIKYRVENDLVVDVQEKEKSSVIGKLHEKKQNVTPEPAKTKNYKIKEERA